MRITEAKFRKILREEAVRAQLFEQAAPASTAPTAPAAQPPASSPQDEAKAAIEAAEKNLTNDLRDVLFGSDGKGGKSSKSGKGALLWQDLYTDLHLGDSGESDDGDMSALPPDIKEKILQEIVDAAKAGTLTSDSFYAVISENYKSTFPDLDPPSQEGGWTYSGTNVWWPSVQAAMVKYQKIRAKFPEAAAVTAAPTGPAGATFPSAAELQGLTPIQQIQKIVGAEPDGKWKQQTNASLAVYISNSKAQIQDAKGAPVPVNLISTNWQKAAPLIKTVNGQPKDYKPTITGITQFLRDISVAPVPAPAAPAAEGAWRRGSRLAEEKQRIRIRWGS